MDIVAKPGKGRRIRHLILIVLRRAMERMTLGVYRTVKVTPTSALADYHTEGSGVGAATTAKQASHAAQSILETSGQRQEKHPLQGAGRTIVMM